MTTKERSQLVQILTQHKVRDRKKMLAASYNIDKMRRKVRGPDSVEIIRKFRGPI